MEKGIKKISYRVLTLVLCLCIVSGAVVPAYADDSTSGYSYYRAGSTLNPYTQQSGKNSADMIGRLLDVSSYNQSMIYNRLLQMSTSGADLTTVNSYIIAIDSKLGVIRDSLGIGSSLENVLSNQTSNLQQLNTIINKLSYWDNNHGRSYDLSEMIFNMMNYDSEITSNTAISASAADQILKAVKKTNGKFFEYYTRGNFPNGNFNDVTISTSETYGAYHANGDGSYQFGSLSGVSDRLEFLAWLHSDLLNVMGMIQTPNSIYKTEYVNSDYTTTSAISLSLQDSIVLGNRILSKNQANIYNQLFVKSEGRPTYINRHNNYDPKQSIVTSRYYIDNNPMIGITGNNISAVYTDERGMSSLGDYLAVLNSNLVQSFGALKSFQTIYHANYITGEGITNEYEAFSVMDMLEGINYSVANGLSDLVYMLADPDSIQAKKNNAAQEAAVLDNFTGSGSAAPSVSDFGAVKDSMVDLKAGFSGGASSSDTFSFLSGDSNAWDWFTQDIANDLDRTQGSNTRLLRSSSSVASDTPLLDSYYTSILSILGGEE